MAFCEAMREKTAPAWQPVCTSVRAMPRGMRVLSHRPALGSVLKTTGCPAPPDPTQNSKK
jgi:hypothetical protein